MGWGWGVLREVLFLTSHSSGNEAVPLKFNGRTNLQQKRKRNQTLCLRSDSEEALPRTGSPLTPVSDVCVVLGPWWGPRVR